MNFLSEYRDLLGELDNPNGRMQATAYDTAWAARLVEHDKDLALAALDWLREHQNADGSWGAKHPNYYDQVTSTLSALIALAKHGHQNRDLQRIENGLSSLGKIVTTNTGLQGEPTIAFEMIVPALVSEATRLGLIDGRGETILSRLAEPRRKKLERLEKHGHKIDRNITLSFSIELAGDDSISLLDAENLQEENGSIGVSPSATAYFAAHVRPGDRAALDYLNRTQASLDGGLPNVAPFNVFERAWVLRNLFLSSGGSITPDLLALAQPHVEFLRSAWTPTGVSYTAGLATTDADDSAITYAVLNSFDCNVEETPLLAYEEEEHFRCFYLEIAPSISANIHVAGALRQAGYAKEHPAFQKILGFLERTRKHSYWADKWHLSPYYTTAQAILSLGECASDLVGPAVQWLIDTQRPLGGWGQFGPSPEETAYALQALTTWKRQGMSVPIETLRRGQEWLIVHRAEPNPALWIGKCLYCPDLVVRSAVLSALLMVESVL